MIFGLLSDTHGNLPRTRKALEILLSENAAHIFHCGDVGSEAVLDLLFEVQENGVPVTAVLGNVDEWESDLLSYAAKLGIPLLRLRRLEVAGLRIALHHGHYDRLMQELAADPALDLLFTGHTHVPRDEKQGHVRIINPGAVHRANPPGVSVLDTDSGRLRFFSIL